jgi:hypothetical protein
MLLWLMLWLYIVVDTMLVVIYCVSDWNAKNKKMLIPEAMSCATYGKQGLCQVPWYVHSAKV